MNLMSPILSFLFVSVLAVGCSGSTSGPPSGGGAKAPPAGGGPGQGEQHNPADRIDLGTAQIGGVAVHAFQVAKPVPGKEGDFDLDFAAGAMPQTVRGWVGAESGVGSMKVRFEKETDTRMHGHPEIPSPLAADARFWVEIESKGATAKGSFAIKP